MIKETFHFLFVKPGKAIFAGTAGRAMTDTKNIFSFLKNTFRSVFPPVTEVKSMTQAVKFGPPETPLFWLRKSLSKTWPMFLFAGVGFYGVYVETNPITKTFYLVGAITPVTVGVLTSLYIYFSRKNQGKKAI